MATVMIPPQVLYELEGTFYRTQTFQGVDGIVINNPSGPSGGSTQISQQGNLDTLLIQRTTGGAVQVFGTNSGQPCSAITLFSNGLDATSTSSGALGKLRIARTPSLSNPAVSSGAVYQNTADRYIFLYVPITYNPTSTAAATCAVAMGVTSTPSTIFTNSEPASSTAGRVSTVSLSIPPGIYWSITVTNATIGTATQIEE